MNVSLRLVQKLLAIFSHSDSTSGRLSLVCSRPHAVITATHRYLRQRDSLLVDDLPTRCDASLAHRNRPACSQTRLFRIWTLVRVCTRLGAIPIGPRGASSVSDWVVQSISAHRRVCASTHDPCCVSLSLFVFPAPVIQNGGSGGDEMRSP